MERKRVSNLAADNLHWVNNFQSIIHKSVEGSVTILFLLRKYIESKTSLYESLGVMFLHLRIVWLADKQVNQVIEWRGRAVLETCLFSNFFLKKKNQHEVLIEQLLNWSWLSAAFFALVVRNEGEEVFLPQSRVSRITRVSLWLSMPVFDSKSW